MISGLTLRYISNGIFQFRFYFKVHTYDVHSRLNSDQFQYSQRAITQRNLASACRGLLDNMQRLLKSSVCPLACTCQVRRRQARKLYLAIHSHNIHWLLNQHLFNVIELKRVRVTHTCIRIMYTQTRPLHYPVETNMAEWLILINGQKHMLRLRAWQLWVEIWQDFENADSVFFYIHCQAPKKTCNCLKIFGFDSFIILGMTITSDQGVISAYWRRLVYSTRLTG